MMRSRSVSSPTLVYNQQSRRDWITPAVHTPRVHEDHEDQTTAHLYAALRVLQARDVEAYIISGVPVRAVRMTEVYHRITALHRALDVVSSSLADLRQRQRQETDRQRSHDGQQCTRQWENKTGTSFSSSSSSPRCTTDATSLLCASRTEQVSEIVDANDVLRYWLTSGEHMSAVAELALLLCRLLHRDGRAHSVLGTHAQVGNSVRPSGTSLAATTGDPDLNQYSGGDGGTCASLITSDNDDCGACFSVSESPSRTPVPEDGRGYTVPWFSISSLLSKLLLVCESGTFVVAPALRSSLLGRWLRLASVLLSTTLPTPELFAVDMNSWYLRASESGTASVSKAEASACETAGKWNVHDVCPDGPSVCFSSSLRADGVYLTRAILMTSSALSHSQVNALLHSVATQLRTPATETRVYEASIQLLSEHVRATPRTSSPLTDNVLASFVMTVLAEMLTREDQQSVALCFSSLPPAPLSPPDCPMFRTTNEDELSPLPDGTLLLPSPVTSALQLPAYESDVCARRGDGKAGRSDNARRSVMTAAQPTTGAVTATVHTATVEVLRPPEAKVVRTATPPVNWRESVVGDTQRSSHGDDDGERSEADALSCSGLPSPTPLTALAEETPSTSVVRAPSLASLAQPAADANGGALARTPSTAVSSETIMQEWYRRFQAPAIHSEQWLHERRGSVNITTSSSGRRACVMSRVEAAPLTSSSHAFSVSWGASPAPARRSPAHEHSAWPTDQPAEHRLSMPSSSSPASALMFTSTPLPEKPATAPTSSLSPFPETALYPSHVALRLRVIDCLRLWCPMLSDESVPCERDNSATGIEALWRGLTQLCRSSVLAVVADVLQASGGRQERALRAALRRFLREALVWVTRALPRVLPSRLSDDDNTDTAQIVVELADALHRCTALAVSATTTAEEASAPTAASSAPPSRVLGATTTKHLRSTPVPLEKTEAQAQRRSIACLALTALTHLLPFLVSPVVVASTDASVESRALATMRGLVPLTLRCLTDAAEAVQTPREAHRALSPPAGRQGDESTAAPTSEVRAKATHVLLLLCTCAPRSVRERVLDKQYVAILRAVVAYVRDQTERLSSSRALVRALAGKPGPRRARAAPPSAGSGSPTEHVPRTVSEGTVPGLCTPDEVRALVNVLEIFSACLSDVLHVHPYMRPGDGFDGSDYYPCLGLISESRFLHTLAHLGSSAVVEVLTEQGAEICGVEPGAVALTVLRRLFTVRGFATEDRVALLAEANTADVSEPATDADDEPVQSAEECATTEAARPRDYAEPLFTMMAQHFRLLDLDTRCSLAIRTHIKKRLVMWARLVFEACPERTTSELSAISLHATAPPASRVPRHTEATRLAGDSSRDQADGDTALALAMLTHRGFLEQLTADVDRAATACRHTSPVMSPNTSPWQTSLFSDRTAPRVRPSAAASATQASREHFSLLPRRSPCPARSEPSPPDASLPIVAEAELTMLLILLKHLPDDEGSDEGDRTASAATPVSVSIRRRLIALRINHIALGVMHARCALHSQQASRQVGEAGGPAVAGTTAPFHGDRQRQRDVLFELSVRVLFEWLRYVRVCGHSTTSSHGDEGHTAAHFALPSTTCALHATDSVQCSGVVSVAAPGASGVAASTTPAASSSPRRRHGVRVLATTQHDFSHCSEEGTRPFDWADNAFQAAPPLSDASLATAPWLRGSSSSGRANAANATGSSLSSTRFGRLVRQTQPRRHTSTPTVVSIDEYIHSSHETQLLSSSVLSATQRRAVGSVMPSASGQARTTEVESLNSAVGSQPSPRLVMEEYLHAYETCLPCPVVEAFHGLLKMGKKKDC